MSTQERYSLARVFIYLKSEMTIANMQKLQARLSDREQFGGGQTEFETAIIVSTNSVALCQSITQGSYGVPQEITHLMGIEVE